MKQKITLQIDNDTGFYHAHNNSRWDDLSKDFEWLDEGGE